MTAPITSALRRLMTAEGARVTADRDEFCGICDAVDSIHARKLKALDASTRRVDELCKENERLRGLVRDMWEYIYVGTAQDGQSLHDRTRELGVEVDG